VPDITPILEIAAGIGMLAVPPIVVTRLIAGRADGSLAVLLAMHADLPWPRGVQEEEPPAWRFEHLAARSPSTSARINAVAGCPARPTRTHPAGARS
jgi:hypothetical protein